MTILPYITIESWLTIISLAIALIVYLFRIDRKVIFYFARRKKPWAVKAAYRLYDEMQAKKIKDRQKRLDKHIQRADELSKAANGRRFYVLPAGESFVIVDSRAGSRWLKENN
jgi:hypothetical protein